MSKELIERQVSEEEKLKKGLLKAFARIGVIDGEPGWIEHYCNKREAMVRDELTLSGELLLTILPAVEAIKKERDALANRVYQLEQKNSGAAEIIAAMQETHAEDQAELKALREQEPACWTTYPPSGRYSKCKAEVDLWERNNWTVVPLYANPVRAGELTDKDIQCHWNEACNDTPQNPGWNRHIRFARAIERYLKGEGE